MTTHADLPLTLVYERLKSTWGPQHWWPGDTPFEIAAGTVLTQNTAWSNVEKAISALAAAGALTATGLLALSQPALEQAIRPAGTFRAKAQYLQALATWIERHAAGNLAGLASEDTETLRCELLTLRGIGQETADSILLYAVGKPAFVVDSYTRRIMARLRLLPENATYETVQQYFVTQLPNDVRLYNEFHALLVRLAKEHCRVRARCPACPLEHCCPSANTRSLPQHPVIVQAARKRSTSS